MRLQFSTVRRGKAISPFRITLTNSTSQTQRPHNDLLFREPNINAA
jgi:hypothetical protein